MFLRGIALICSFLTALTVPERDAGMSKPCGSAFQRADARRSLGVALQSITEIVWEGLGTTTSCTLTPH